MRHMKFIYAVLLGMSFSGFSTLSIGEEAKRVWLGHACYQMHLGVWDKLGGGSYLARYVFKSDDGRILVAEKKGDDDSNTAEVIFPDDFKEEFIFKGKKTYMPAGHCDDVNYTWYIYVNDVLFDTGTIAFSKKGGEHEKRH